MQPNENIPWKDVFHCQEPKQTASLERTSPTGYLKITSKLKSGTPEPKSRSRKTLRKQNMNNPKLALAKALAVCGDEIQPTLGERNEEFKELLPPGIRKTSQKQRKKRLYPTQSCESEDLCHEVKQLILLHSSHPRGHDFVTIGSWYPGMVEKQVHLIDVRELFGPGLGAKEEPHTVVLYGDPGVGKSTLARQVRRAWEEGQLYKDHFQHVFYFNCKYLNQSKIMSLAELITEDWAAPKSPIDQILSQPEKLLFILEGLDEPEWALMEKHDVHLPWREKQPLLSLLSQLLGKTLLPEASLLITIQTGKIWKFVGLLEKPRWVEVLGFSESGRKDYFYNYFPEESQASEALSVAESNHTLWALCLMPWVCWLVCRCLRQQMERGQVLSLPGQTSTALCLQYLSQALPAPPPEAQLNGLCSLAAEGISQRKILFEMKDLKQHGLQGSDISTLVQTGVLQQHPSPLSYSFIHLCFQEFFAAMFFVLGYRKKGERTRKTRKQLEKYFMDDVFGAPTMYFIYGLLSEQGVRETEHIFNCMVVQEMKYELLKWSWQNIRLISISPRSHTLELFCSLYEIQDAKFLTQVMAHFQGTNMCVTDRELLVFTFCIQFCHHVQRLQLNKSGQHIKDQKPPDMVLRTCFPITDACWQIIFSIPGITGSLKELDLSGNFLSLSAVQSLCEALRSPHCHLERLWLVGCGLTSSSCEDLASGLSTSPRLMELDLQHNDLGDHGLRLLYAGLRQPSCQLRLLGLDQAQLNKEMTEMLRALEKEKPQLIIYPSWKPPVMTPPEDTRGTEMSDNKPSLEQQTSEPDHEPRSILKAHAGEHPKVAEMNDPKPFLEPQILEPGALVSQSDTSVQIPFSIPRTLKKMNLSGNFLSCSAVQNICEALRHPDSQLESLRLVCCGLTSINCQDLASMLSTSPRLTVLDLRQNDLGNLGVRLLCEGVRQSSCQLRFLGLDQAQLSEEVTEMLRALEREKPWLLIYPRRAETSGYTASLEQQTPEPEGSPPQMKQAESFSPSSLVALSDLLTETLTTRDEYWDPTGHVTIEVIDQERSLHRARFPMAGTYPWSNTGLQFVIRESVTIEIEFCTWDPFLDRLVPQEDWMVAGPLFDIKAKPGAVAAVYLPHFVSLQGNHVDISKFHVAHFKEEGMVLEKPTRVEACYTILENPSFSPMGVLLRILPVARNLIPITTTIMLYHHLRPEGINFHLYLIPDDCSIRKAIDDEEKKSQFVRIHKPPPLTPLYLGSRFIISGSEKMEINSPEVELCYRSSKESQLFSEIYIGHLESGIQLQIKNKKDGTVVWEALVKPGDLRPAAALAPPALTGAPRPPHFVDQYRGQLVARVTSVDPVLDRLHGQGLSEEQYEKIRAEATTQDQMRMLFSFSRSWDWACKDRLYQALKETHPHLIKDLWEKGDSGGH